MRVIACIALLLLVSGRAQAQTAVTGSSGIAFFASADHNTIQDGAPILTNYQFDIVSQTGLFFTQNLMKPTPNAAGEIVVKPISAFGTLVNAVAYTAVVKAVGPGGASASVPSDPFCSSSRRNGPPKHWKATCGPVGQ